MKKSLILGLISITGLLSGCSSPVSNTTNSTNAPVANTTNSAPATVENKTTNTAAAPKKEADTAKKTDSKPSESISETRVQFGKGETSTTVTKDIPANGVVDFVFNVKKGQTVEYTVGYDFNDSDLQIYMGEPGDQDASIPSTPKAPKSFVVKKSGDHRLEVTNKTKKKVTITLYMDIEELSPSKAG
jgi:hypothetical protein